MQTYRSLCRLLLEKGFPFLTPQLHQQRHKYNIKHGATPKLPTNNPPVHPPPPHQQHQHLLPTRNPKAVPTPQTHIKTLVIAPEVPSTSAQQENLQEVISEFDNLLTSHNIEYNPLQVATTQEGDETVIPQPPQDLHLAINSVVALSNPSTAMTPSISATTTRPSVIPEHTSLLQYYYLDLSISILQQLLVKW